MVLLSNFFFKGLWSEELMEGGICLLLGTHTYTLHHNYYYYSDREFVPAFKLKLASTFILTLVKEKLAPLNSL